jgi:hypothetical protein
MEEILSTAAVPAIIALALVYNLLVITHSWRINLLLLVILYLGVFILTAQSWPLELAVVKLIAGWMASAVIGIASIEQSSQDETLDRAWPSSRVFRILASALVLVTAVSITGSLNVWIPGLSHPQAAGGLILSGMGLLQVGLTARPLRAVIGLLTVLAGFEIIYAAVEASALLAGLLAVINLGLALIGVYLITAPQMEQI